MATRLERQMFGSLSQYPTFDVFIAVSAAMFLMVASIPLLVKLLRRLDIGQEIRADGPEGHHVKQGTPTMGGVAIMVISALVFAVVTVVAVPGTGSSAERLANFLDSVDAAILVVGTMLACGVLGFVDDYSKVVNKRSLGLTPRAKLIGQTLIGLAFSVLAVNWVGIAATVNIPMTTIVLDLGVVTSYMSIGQLELAFPWLYILFASVMIVGMSNAVNLTDGLDGLAAGTVTIVTLVFGAIAYSQNSLPVAIAASAIAGCCIGFLWWNTHPADIFMGDTGALGLGGGLGALAAVTKTELLLLVICGIFVVEAASVVIQVWSYKRTGRRIFKMAPIHHHFEMIGWSETKIMVRFWIVTSVLAGLGFATYFYQATQMGQ